MQIHHTMLHGSMNHAHSKLCGYYGYIIALIIYAQLLTWLMFQASNQYMCTCTKQTYNYI